MKGGASMRLPVRLPVWLLIISLAFVFSTAVSASAPAASNPFQKEIDMGKEAVKEVEKDCKLVKDEAVLARVKAIGDKIAQVAKSQEVAATYGSAAVADFNYTFKVIDDKTVNAFSLPGGHVYIHTGLLDFVESDHELAAVIAHEIAHAAHHHAKNLVQMQARMQSKLALILLAGLVGNIPNRDMSNLVLGTQFYKTARMSGYGQEAERDADSTSLSYLLKTDYNPVGMLTFLERLDRRPELFDPGIYRTHPQIDERVTQVLGALKEKNIEIKRRSVTKAAKAEVQETTDNNIKAHEVVLADKSVVKLAGDVSRADKLAASINTLLDGKTYLKDVKAVGGTVTVNGSVIVEITQQDTSLNGKDTTAIAASISDTIQRAIWQEMVYLMR